MNWTVSRVASEPHNPTFQDLQLEDQIGLRLHPRGLYYLRNLAPDNDIHTVCRVRIALHMRHTFGIVIANCVSPFHVNEKKNKNQLVHCKKKKKKKKKGRVENQSVLKTIEK